MAFYGVAPVRFGTASLTTATLGPNDPELGVRMEDSGDRYIFIYNGGGTQISVGNGAVLSSTSGYTVTVSSVTHTDFPVGVCKHATIAASSYGWLLTRGFSSAQAGSAVATANGLTLGADGNWQAQLTATAYSQVQSPTVYGKAMGSAASSATFPAYFNIG